MLPKAMKNCKAHLKKNKLNNYKCASPEIGKKKTLCNLNLEIIEHVGM